MTKKLAIPFKQSVYDIIGLSLKFSQSCVSICVCSWNFLMWRVRFYNSAITHTLNNRLHNGLHIGSINHSEYHKQKLYTKPLLIIAPFLFPSLSFNVHTKSPNPEKKPRSSYSTGRNTHQLKTPNQSPSQDPNPITRTASHHKWEQNEDEMKIIIMVKNIARVLRGLHLAMRRQLWLYISYTDL